MKDPILNPIVHNGEFLEFINRPLTFEEALEFLRYKKGKSLDEKFVREWHEDMDAACWADKQGHTIRNWPGMFHRWQMNRARFEALRAVPPAMPYRGHTPPRADNYIRASEADIQRFKEEII